MNREVKKYMSQIGRKGGKSKSEAKSAASRKNLDKARKVKKIWLAIVKKALGNMSEIQRMKALFCKE